MTEFEYDVLDELYFVTSYKDLAQHLELNSEIIQNTLIHLMEKNWVQQLEFHQEKGEYIKCVNFTVNNLENYAYLATKVGLLAHNGIG